MSGILERIKEFFKGILRQDSQEGQQDAGIIEEQDQALFEEKKEFALIEKYQDILRQADFRIKAIPWIGFAFIAATIAAVLTALIITLAFPKITVFFTIVVFLVTLDIVLGYPYLIAMKRIDSIEEALPDALKQMSDSLKAGGTYEYALREIATSEYGALTKEMELVLRKIEEGQNLETALRDFAENVNSRLIKRAVTVIVDSVKAGAGLAEVLDAIADDIRAMHRIEKERITETQLQIMFMISAGSIVAPIILGLVTTVIDLFINAATTLNINPVEVQESIMAKNAILTLMQLYIFIEVTASSVMIAIMRHGKVGKSMLYIPVLLLIAYILYYSSSIVSASLIGGLQ